MPTFAERCAMYGIPPHMLDDVYRYCYPTQPKSERERVLLESEVQFKLEKLRGKTDQFYRWWHGRGQY